MAEARLASPPASDPSDASRSRRSRLRGWAVLRRVALLGVVVDVVAVLACGIEAAWPSRGMDVSWDLLNYHYYYSYLLFHGGIGQADPEPFVNRFVNPLAQLPWYLFDQWFRPRTSSFMIGMLAGCNLPLVRRITLRLLPAGLGQVRALALSVAAAAIAVVGAVFQAELGGSLADVIVSLPALGGVLLVLRGASGGKGASWWPYALAGVMGGIASGAKLTMVPYTLALGVTVVALAVWCRRPAFLVAHGCGAVVGLLAATGWWSWSLWQTERSPFFPFFNSVFGSPDWSGPDFRDPRYGPHSVGEALSYPFAMLRGTRLVSDVPLRDPRWVVLLVLIALALVVLVVERALGADPRATLRTLFAPLPLVAFATFGVVGSLLWLVEFGYARYGATSELLVGPALVVLLRIVLRRALLTAVAGVVLAAAMYPFIMGYFLHVPFQPNRFMVDAAPLGAVPAGSVVVADAGSAPSSFLLAYLPDGVSRHVVHPQFYGKPLMTKFQREVLADAPDIYLIEGWNFRARAPRVLDGIGVALEPSSCRPIMWAATIQPRYLCRARWVGPVGRSVPQGAPPRPSR